MSRRWLALAAVTLALLLPAAPVAQALSACSAHHAAAPEDGRAPGSHRDDQCPGHTSANRPSAPVHESAPRMKCACSDAIAFVLPVAPPAIAFALGVPIGVTVAVPVAPAAPIVATAYPTTPPPRA